MAYSSFIPKEQVFNHRDSVMRYMSVEYFEYYILKICIKLSILSKI